MSQSKTANRVVVIGGTTPASRNAAYRNPVEQRPMARRIVVIKNGKSVESRRGP